MTRWLSRLWVQVLAATALGLLLGLFRPDLGAAMKPLGDGFISMVRMMIPPIIFCTVVHGVAAMRSGAALGRVALKALVYFEAVTTMALVVALVAVNVWQPGAGMNIDLSTVETKTLAPYLAAAHEQSVTFYLLHIIPTTLLSAFTEGEVLQVLLVSVLFGVALAAVGERGEPITALVERLSRIFFAIVELIMKLAPIGAFGAMAFTIGKFGSASLISLGSLIAEFFLLCAAFTLIVFGAIARLAGIRLIRLLAYMRDEIVIVAATTSTETVLPRVVEKMRAVGCAETVVGFVVPAGYSFNLDGTCLYLATVAVFLAQATNTPLDLWQQLGLVAVLLLTSKGAAGVAGAAFVVLAATLATTHSVPVASVALVLGIHRILAEGLTFVNLIGNCLAVIVIARWEGAVDEEKLATTLGRG